MERNRLKIKGRNEKLSTNLEISKRASESLQSSTNFIGQHIIELQKTLFSLLTKNKTN